MTSLRNALASIVLCTFFFAGCTAMGVSTKPAPPVAEKPSEVPLEEVSRAPVVKEVEPAKPSIIETEPLPGAPPEEPKKAEAATLIVKRDKSSTHVRSVPSTRNNKPIATLKAGTEVEKIDEKGAWYKVRFVDAEGHQKEGWISKSRIEQ